MNKIEPNNKFVERALQNVLKSEAYKEAYKNAKPTEYVVSGSFVSADKKTITVKDGLIVSIV